MIAGELRLNFGSNNYLGLANDERVIDAAAEAAARWGSGVTGSRLLNGNLELHEEIEEELARFYGREAALVFPTGYTANLGALAGLLQPGDRAYLDHEAHASLVDGTLLSRAKLRRFRHNSVDRFRSLVRSEDGTGCVCVIEGIYSMRGDAAPVGAFDAACADTGSFLVVDEAHALGTMGPTGAGVAERDGVVDRVDLLTITFSKSLASCGGAVIGDREIIEFLRLTSRPFVFTASNAPSTVAAALCSLRLLQAEPEMVTQVQDRASQFATKLRAHGVPVHQTDGPILTIPTGSDFSTLQAWKLAWNRDLFCNSVVSPAVEQGRGLLRLSVTRLHTDEDLDEAAVVCAAVFEMLPQPKHPDDSLEQT
jgi:8-amino-7-oxononanoate synthase